MDKLLALLSFILSVGIIIVTFPDGNVAMLVAAALSVVTIGLIHRFRAAEKILLTRLFLGALFTRLIFGTFIHVFDLRERLSGDSDTYHLVGKKLMSTWFGLYDGTGERFLTHFSTFIGWGMAYFVAGIYSITGADILSAQFTCAVIGAATVPLVYVCVKKIFNNHRASLISASLIAFYPAFIIWTSQLLKDGLIVFCLVLAMTMILSLREKFSYGTAFVLVLSLFAISSLRFYIFYMIAAAMVGAFVVGYGESAQSTVRNIVILVLLGLGLTSFGTIGNVSSEIADFGSLERLQRSRQGASQSASGFGQDMDVSTAQGAISAIPVGFVYVMFAPFPWQFTGTQYLIALPDMIIWWLAVPFLLIGLNFAIRKKLRSSLGVLIFSLMLTLAYSLFQGNIGTAYRHRIQIQVFLFMFVGVGWTLILERRENKKELRDAEKLRFSKKLGDNQYV